MIARRSAVLLATVALVTALAACAPAAAPKPSPTPTGFASKEEAFAAAEKTYREYVDALNEVDLSDPATFEPVFSVMAGSAVENERKTLSEYHAEKMTVEGQARITKLEPLEWMPEDGRAKLGGCLDVSEIDVVNPSGKSIVSDSRPDVQSVLITLESDIRTRAFKIVSLDGRDGEPSC
ncbi:hypothetical protein [Microbacterium sp. 77mftsu3.1]|uniref:hypothetical protein n=1 Tax=Microbacterium sp. 77mftsu3.1 TaxID=1761802 RepID=UPI0003A8D357|nr:hypothetical protein [Microbacterium sp. 77mftsu3.1]SDG99972.1 hypothetical protein SAMN04488590_2302 [Microbacterium sp. 77mftsu3.1]